MPSICECFNSRATQHVDSFSAGNCHEPCPVSPGVHVSRQSFEAPTRVIFKATSRQPSSCKYSTTCQALPTCDPMGVVSLGSRYGVRQRQCTTAARQSYPTPHLNAALGLPGGSSRLPIKHMLYAYYGICVLLHSNCRGACFGDFS
jgi:hypothetical protein